MKAVVCGAGSAGLAAAHCLSRHGWEVVVLERAPAPGRRAT
ncbi:FAD-dependent oxidoreductase [Streptomyces sp. AA4]|nr:FAD-dependent oxidoreductase [Streptomyces sp. AA4]